MLRGNKDYTTEKMKIDTAKAVRKRTRKTGTPSKTKASKADVAEGKQKTIGQVGYTHQIGAKPIILKEGFTKKLCDNLVAGNTVRNACALSGVEERTYYRYLADGETAEEGSLLWQFCQSVKKAIAEAEHRNILLIQTAAKKSWQAAAWYLERRHNKDWGQQAKIKLASDADDPLVVATVDLNKTIPDTSAMTALKAVLKRSPELAPS